MKRGQEEKEEGENTLRRMTSRIGIEYQFCATSGSKFRSLAKLLKNANWNLNVSYFFSTNEVRRAIHFFLLFLAEEGERGVVKVPGFLNL